MKVLALTLAAVLAAPACAQHATRETSTYVSEDHDGHRVEVRIVGEAEFNDAGDWVQRVGPGGSVRVVEGGRRGERRVDFTRGADGAVLVRFLDDGRARALDGDARAWAQRTIRHAVREGAIGARTRVPRIRARQGVQGVLNEIAQIRSDTGKRLYFLALLGGAPLSSAEFDRVMAEVGRRITSDTERRLVLLEGLQQASDGGRVASVLEALQGVDSDVEVRLVLINALERSTLSDASAVTAFFRAVNSLQSDTERRIVLTQLSGRGLGMRVREPFFQAVREIGSDTERRIVLSGVMEGAPTAVVVAALGATSGMRSDVEKRIVLSQVPSDLLDRRSVVDAYQQVLRTMSSDSERAIALRRLAAGH